MAGNSQPRNRRASGKKGAQVGSGGNRRRGLEGKGPTPPASARKGHVKNRIANAKARQQAGRPQRARRGGRSSSVSAEAVTPGSTRATTGSAMCRGTTGSSSEFDDPATSSSTRTQPSGRHSSGCTSRTVCTRPGGTGGSASAYFGQG